MKPDAIKIPVPPVAIGQYVTREQVRKAIMDADLDVKEVQFCEFCTYITRRETDGPESLHIVDLIVPERGLKKIRAHIFSTV